MLVKVKNNDLLNGYFSLDLNTKYRVIAISISLDSNILYALVVRSENKNPHVAFVDLNKLDICDNTPENDWVSCIFTKGISEQTIVLGPKELTTSLDTYIRIHDINYTKSDMDIIWKYYGKYGENLLS